MWTNGKNKTKISYDSSMEISNLSERKLLIKNMLKQAITITFFGLIHLDLVFSLCHLTFLLAQNNGFEPFSMSFLRLEHPARAFC